MVKRNIKWLLVVLVLGLCPSILHAEYPYGEMKALADSAQKVLGQDLSLIHISISRHYS